MEALTLQQSCLLFLVTKLDEFHPEALRLLPARLRYQLFATLPPVDLCKLEKTQVMEGLDVNRIWSGVCERSDLRRLALDLCGCVKPWINSSSSRFAAIACSDEYPCICRFPTNSNASWQDSLVDAGVSRHTFSWKECFTNALSSFLVSSSLICDAGDKKHGMPIDFLFNSFEIALCILFTGDKPHRMSVKNYRRLVFQYCGRTVRLQRLSGYLDTLQESRASQRHIIQLAYMMVKFDLVPKSLCIGNREVEKEDPILEWVKPNSLSIVGPFLSKVAILKLCLKGSLRHNLLGYGYFVIKSILSLPSHSLESLKIIENESQRVFRRSNVSLIKTILVNLSPLLTNKSTDVNHVVHSRGIQPFAGLKDFQVTSKYKLERSTFVNAIATRELMNIVAYQKHLESLTVSGVWGWSSKVQTTRHFQSFCGSLFSCHLSLVWLKDLDIPVPLLQTLLQVFFQLPGSSQQTFVLQSVWMFEPDADLSLGSLSSTSSNSLSECYETSKCLHFFSMHVPNYFLSWLSTLPSLPLKEVELSDIQYDADMRPGGITAVLGSHAHCSIASMCISCHTVDCPSEALDILLRKKSLRSLTLVEPKTPLLSSLVQGLHSLNSDTGSSLEYLAVRSPVLSEGEGVSREALLSALHHLPHFSDVTIDLSGIVLGRDLCTSDVN